MRWLGYRSVGSGRCSPVLRLSLLLCFSVSPFALLFSPSRNISLARPFYLPRYLSFFLIANSLHRVVVRLFYYFYKCRRHHTTTTTGHEHRSITTTHHHLRRRRCGGHFLCWPRHGPLLLARKMRILIRYCLILFMYARAREPAHFKAFPCTLAAACYRFLPLHAKPNRLCIVR